MHHAFDAILPVTLGGEPRPGYTAYLYLCLMTASLNCYSSHAFGVYTDNVTAVSHIFLHRVCH